MSLTVADLMIQRLFAWGVRTIYGYPGDGINGLMAALERADHRIRFVQPRHEESAAFMACARVAGPALVVIVLNNADLNMVTWEQRVMTGMPTFEPSQDLPSFPYARYAHRVGLDGIEVDKPEQIGDALDRALASNRPAVVEVHVDPEVPPLPPHISFDQAKNLMASLFKGDPNRWRVIKQSAKQLWTALTS